MRWLTLGFLAGLQFFNHAAFADELKIFVIKPKVRIDWSNPRDLAITSGLDSSGNDYAPIGHFAVQVTCSQQNQYGVRSVLTGMERQDKRLSRKITIDEKLGLGSLFYAFKGQLETKSSTLTELKEALTQQRLKIISVPTSPARCEAMLDFIDQWIASGSYEVYGGGKNVAEGEGSGCADFAMKLFEIATWSNPPSDWIVKINVPKSLIGDGKKKKVSFTAMLERNAWAYSGEPQTPFAIPDSNLVWDWLNQHTQNSGMKPYQYTKHLFPNGLIYNSDDPNAFQTAVREAANELPGSPKESKFEFHYLTNKKPTVVWNSIKAF